jgi:3-hydroxyisobutyrate dehydrogenase-like beta-hydroxyacid dehydrogenase
VTDQTPAVGLIGIGLMGEALALRLIGSGLRVVGYDIDPAKVRRLEALGGEPATGVADLARHCDLFLLAVFDTDQVEAVVENDLLPVLDGKRGKILLCTSTCDPDRIARLGARVAASGVAFLEAPVSGTSEQVKRGEGVGLIAGDREVAARASSVLSALFPVHFHVGMIGDGGRAKLAVNLILGLNRVALAEGLVFARRLGLDPVAFLKVARGSAAYSQVMDTKGQKMLDRDFTAEGRVRQTLKDVNLMLEQARKTRQPLPLLEVHADVLQACVRAGEGDCDNSVVFEEIWRRGEKG